MWNYTEIIENSGCDSIFKTLGSRINLKLKNMGAKIRITLIRIIPTQFPMTRFIPTQQTLNLKIDMILPTVVYYINRCHVIHMIHNPVHFKREPYHATLPMEHSFPVTLHLYHLQINHHCQQASYLQNCYDTQQLNQTGSTHTKLI